MTKEQFQDRWRYHLAGIVLDATACRTSEERALFLRNVLAKIDSNLGSMYDQMQPKQETKKP